MGYKILAVRDSGHLREPFTTNDIRQWIIERKILKDDGTPYAKSSVNAILSNSDLANRPTTNRNSKSLRSIVDSNRRKAYWFVD